MSVLRPKKTLEGPMSVSKQDLNGIGGTTLHFGTLSGEAHIGLPRLRLGTFMMQRFKNDAAWTAIFRVPRVFRARERNPGSNP